MAKKIKNVSEFSPNSKRIYDSVKKAVANRTSPIHVMREIDKKLDKHALSTEGAKAEIEKEVKNLTSQLKTQHQEIVGEKEDAINTIKLAHKLRGEENQKLTDEHQEYVEKTDLELADRKDRISVLEGEVETQKKLTEQVKDSTTELIATLEAKVVKLEKAAEKAKPKKGDEKVEQPAEIKKDNAEDTAASSGENK